MNNPTISELLAGITEDHTHGARVLAENGLHILSHALESDELLGHCTSISELFHELQSLGMRIANARPSMKTAIKTRVLRALKGIKNAWDDKASSSDEEALPESQGIDHLRRVALQTLEEERQRCEEEIGKLEVEFVKYFETVLSGQSGVGKGGKENGESTVDILTLSASSTVVTCLVKAINEYDMRINLTVLESRPMFAGVWLARNVMEKLDKDKWHNLNLKITVDSAVVMVASKPGTTLVIGADRISSDGSVLNAVGSAVAALVANNCGNKTLIVSETAKISSNYSADDATNGNYETVEENDPKEVSDAWRLEGQAFKNELMEATTNRYFEWVPADQIHAYVTEIGVINMEKIKEIGSEFAKMEKEMFGGL